jgi:hypothetical protein
MKKSQLKQIIKEEIIKILNENDYLDQLLDKISSSGENSLSSKEKNYLDQYSKGTNPESLSPKTFKVRLEKNNMGVYDSYMYAKDNSWIPQQIFDTINSLYYEPQKDNRIPIVLNTYPKPDPESNMTSFKSLNTSDPEAARILGDKEGYVINTLMDLGNIDDLTAVFSPSYKIKIPGKYIDLLRYD